MNRQSFHPAYPLISTDLHLSAWSNSDHPAASDTIHRTGARKRITLTVSADGKPYALIGHSFSLPKAELALRTVIPTKTEYVFDISGIKIAVSFRVPISDLYDTKTGRFRNFIARSVQGGIFMPMLKKHWAEQQA